MTNTLKKQYATKCPFGGTRVTGLQGSGPNLDDWYPDRLRVEILNSPSAKADPYSKDSHFDYTEAFNKLDYWQLKEDLNKFMTTSQPWWPADYGNYGPQMIRTTWHSAGTYRIADGRGGLGNGLQRFLPLDSWLDNGNTDKTRRLLWPIKQKYGDNISWADLIALAGNVALENMGVKTSGFAGGRLDAWENDNATYWGDEMNPLGRESRWQDKDGEHDLANPLGDADNELIYVNPEGPNANGDPHLSANEIRQTFGRMAMNDEETAALIAGGHTFGKSHGAVSADNMGPPPGKSSIENQGLGWINSAGSGNAEFTVTNGCEGSWTQNPTTWDKEYLVNLLDLEWEQTRSPAGALQWTPKAGSDKNETPDAHIKGKTHPLMMFTSDIALKVDPSYNKILTKWRNSDETVFFKAFSEAWYKLIHRDLGPKSRYLGPEIPKEDRIWQDIIPEPKTPLIDNKDIDTLKSEISAITGIEDNAFARAAWAAASTYRGSDKRGGVNGARIRLAPQKDWEINRPEELAKVISALEGVQSKFNSSQKEKEVSLADLIVLAGNVDIEKAAKKAGFDVTVPFHPGRGDSTLEQTDVESFEWLKPVVDGFRQYQLKQFNLPTESFLIDRANLLSLTAPEMTVLIGGARALNFNYDGSDLGILTKRPGALTNDFFVNLLTMDTKWTPVDEHKIKFEGTNRYTGEHQWNATRTDLIFGHHAQLRATAEVYGASTGQERFVKDFVAAWAKVTELDRFDLHRNVV